MSSIEPESCFVIESIHEIARSKYYDESKHLVRLNNYDHVTAERFKKLKILLNDLNLSRFKKPTPKICVACCKHLNDLIEDDKHVVKESCSHTPSTSIILPENTSFDNLLTQIKTMDLTNDQLNRLMHAVGERLAPLANKHVTKLNKSNLGNRLEDMVEMTYQSYWKNAFQPLKNLLLGLINGARYDSIRSS